MGPLSCSNNPEPRPPLKIAFSALDIPPLTKKKQKRRSFRCAPEYFKIPSVGGYGTLSHRNNFLRLVSIFVLKNLTKLNEQRFK